MFVDGFIQICISVLISEKTKKDVIDLIASLVNDYERRSDVNKTGYELSLFGLLKWLLEYRLERNYFDFTIMISELQRWKLESHVDLLKNLKEELTDEKLQYYIDTIKSKKKLSDIFILKEDILKIFEKLEGNGSIETELKILNEWKYLVAKTHQNLVELDRVENILKAAELDLMSDDYSGVFDELNRQISGKSVIPTGFRFLDNNVLSMGGFESRRLYLIAGSSGVGKSMFLINLLVNCILNESLVEPSSTNKIRTLLYITAENLLDETFLRFYCCLTKTPYSQVLKKLSKSKYNSSEHTSDEFKEMEDHIKSILKEYKMNVIFKYVNAHTTSVYDVENIVSMVSDKYDLKCLYLDYLDLVSSGQRYSEYRRELGVVTKQLKNISIQYNIPVVTATQLNRSGYNPESEPSLVYVSESIEKVNNSDFVLLLQEAKNQVEKYEGIEYKPIRATVKKHRSGMTYVPVTVYYPLRNIEQGTSVFDFSLVELDEISLMTTDGENTDYSWF